MQHLGPNLRRGVANAEEALALYLETLGDLGKPLPDDKDLAQRVSLGVTVRMPTIV